MNIWKLSLDQYQLSLANSYLQLTQKQNQLNVCFQTQYVELIFQTCPAVVPKFQILQLLLIVNQIQDQIEKLERLLVYEALRSIQCKHLHMVPWAPASHSILARLFSPH